MTNHGLFFPAESGNTIAALIFLTLSLPEERGLGRGESANSLSISFLRCKIIDLVVVLFPALESMPPSVIF